MKTRLFYFLLTSILLSSCVGLRQRQASAWENIETLKEGAVLVRLQTGEKKVAALKKAGLEERAIKAEEAQKVKNQMIVDAFKAKFDYCPVYFFYAPNSSKIKKENFNGVVLDSDLKPINSSETIGSGTWFLSELGQTQDPLQENRTMDQEVKASKGVYSFVLKDRNFVQLVKPFPYANRVYSDTPLQYHSAVAGMNQNLYEFQLEAKVKKEKRKLKDQRRALRQG